MVISVLPPMRMKPIDGGWNTPTEVSCGHDLSDGDAKATRAMRDKRVLLPDPLRPISTIALRGSNTLRLLGPSSRVGPR